MKSLTPEYLAEIGKNVTTLTSCLHIKRIDNTEYFFTSYDRELEIDGNTYIPTDAYIPTDFSQNLGFSVDNMDITGIISETGITKFDLLKGLFGDAEVWIFLVNYNDLSQSKEKLLYGNLGEVSSQGNTYNIELRSLSQKLSQNVGKLYSRVCRATFGDSECDVSVPSDNGTIPALPASITFKYLKIKIIETVN